MSQPEIHDQIRIEVERRLAIAREAWLEPPQTWYSVKDLTDKHANGGAGLADFDAAHIALHDPADAIRRYEYTLRLLDTRHRPVVLRGGAGAKYYKTTLVCATCSPPQFGEDAWPCPELVDLAESLGIEVPTERTPQ